MNRFAVAVLALLIGACATTDRSAPAAPMMTRIGFISDPCLETLNPAQCAELDRAADRTGTFDVEEAPPFEDEDPPRDAAHPARNRQLVIPSGPVVPALGRPAEMNALMFVAAGAGPHPTLLLLHGLPGNERNLDLAQAARRAGWNVLTFTYRGAWGSEGTFSIQHAVADTEAALAYLRSNEAAVNFNVDPARIVVGGHSMGGYMAAHVAAADARCTRRRYGSPTAVHPGDIVPAALRPCSEHPPLAGVILLDAWDIAASARMLKAGGAEGRAGFIAGFDDVGHALGPITAADIADNLIRRGEEWSLPALAPALARLRVLAIDATDGNAADNRAFREAIERVCAPAQAVQCLTLTALVLTTDHAFADHRLALAREVVGWLRGVAPPD